MQIVTTILLFGVLITVGVCLFYIWTLEGVYARLFFTRAAIPVWRRKRWAFILLFIDYALGAMSLLWPQRWVPAVFLSILIAAFCGLADSYRLLLADLRRLPVKREHITPAGNGKKQEQ